VLVQRTVDQCTDDGTGRADLPARGRGDQQTRRGADHRAGSRRDYGAGRASRRQWRPR
jgi:hypothetical protein